MGCVGLGSGFRFGAQIPITTAIYDCLRVRGSEVPLFSFAIIFDHRCLAHRSVLRSMGLLSDVRLMMCEWGGHKAKEHGASMEVR